MSSTPIAAHALLSDRHCAALVDSAGAVVWLSFPRFDSPTVFAQLLDEDAGHWQLRPVGPARITRRYVEQTLVLQTTFATDDATVVLTDALVMDPQADPHRLGSGAPHLLVRRMQCTAGRVDVQTTYQPRPEFGLITPLLSTVDGGVTSRGGAEWLVLSIGWPLELDEGTARGRLTLHAGQSTYLGLHRSTLNETPARIWTQTELGAALQGTVEAWRAWSDVHQNYDGPWRELVHHSGRVLQGLSYQPSGAIIAAATTSLPERIGGDRNWDYRYSWVRDASFTMEALWVAACPDEAAGFFAFMTTAAAGSLRPGRPLQIMFGVGGEHDLTERTLPQLRGWRGSAPVRVGNGAWEQPQIDVYGEILAAAFRLRGQLGSLDAQTRRFLTGCADAAAERWQQPDHGIWESRGEPRHFLYSKVMCWVALDRAIALTDVIGPTDRKSHWQDVRAQIRTAVLDEGWNESAGAFTQYFGSSALDAAALTLPLVGFLPATDPRMLRTIDAIAEQLTDERGLIYRYRAGDGSDGLEGAEGAFLLCTFWLAQALAQSGQLDRARAVFERAVGFVNDVGLLAEEVDAASGELLGNFPQAFSHIGLINAAWAISEASGG